MALNKSGFNNVSTPRVYLDVIEYAKAIGYIKSFTNVNQTPINGDSTYPNVFDYNASRVVEYIADNQFLMQWNCRFKNYDKSNINLHLKIIFE